jgi:hypothetical protein
MYFKKIKFKFLIISSLLIFNFSNAQKIKEKDGLVTLDSKPFVKMIKTKAWMIYNDFTIQNLSEIDLATFNYRTKTRNKWDKEKRKNVEETIIYYTVDFTESGAHAVINEQLSKKMVVKILLKNKLVKGGVIDPLAEKQYINRMGGSYPRAIPTHLSKSPIVLKENIITIDGKTVGKYIEKFSDTTKTSFMVSIYNAKNNEKIAEAKASANQPMEWEVKTMSDEKTTSILYDAPEEKEKLFKWLVQKKYLQ